MNDEDLAIEIGVPLPAPTKRGSGKVSRIAAEMRIGDSIGSKKINTCNAIGVALKRLGRKGTTRKMGNGFRVWRIE